MSDDDMETIQNPHTFQEVIGDDTSDVNSASPQFQCSLIKLTGNRCTRFTDGDTHVLAIVNKGVPPCASPLWRVAFPHRTFPLPAISEYSDVQRLAFFPTSPLSQRGDLVKRNVDLIANEPTVSISGLSISRGFFDQ
jgi:hypothetical protein